MRKLPILLALVAGLFISEARADFTAKDAAAATITFKNPGVCTAVVCVPVFQLYDGTNVVTLTTAGADAVSNTLIGLPTYSRNLVFNGTTWDRWQGAVTLTSGTLTTVSTVTNLSQMGGAAIAMGTGVRSAGTQRVTIATDDVVPASQSGTWNVTNISGTVSLPTGASTAANQATEISSLATIATNSALPLPAQSNFTTNIGAVTLNDANSNAVLNDPCQTVAKTYTPINVVTATNTIITGVSAKKKYICGIFLYPAGTTNVAIFQATTATACATALVGVIGGTTTATGMVMTAQAGFVLGTGISSIAATTVNQTDLCIVTSAAVQVSGVVVTVDR